VRTSRRLPVPALRAPRGPMRPAAGDAAPGRVPGSGVPLGAALLGSAELLPGLLPGNVVVMGFYLAQLPAMLT
jgi:hypothetical protein